MQKCDMDYLRDHYQQGGDGRNSNPCDDWPVVPAVDVTQCPCPPVRAAYDRLKAAAWLSCLPLVGDAIQEVIGLPKDCTEAFQDSTADYLAAQSEFVKVCQEIQGDFADIVQIFAQISSGDDGNGNPQGLLPDTLRFALSRGKYLANYLAITALAAFLILLGVVFTL